MSMAALPLLAFQPLPANDDDDDNANEHDPVATGRTLQRKLQMHGVAHGRAVGVKRKPEGVGFSSSALLWIFCIFLACGVALALFLTLG